MNKYETLIEINRKEVFGEAISSQDKEMAVSAFLNGMNRKEEVQNFKRRMRVNDETDTIYPQFFIPPYNGTKKLRLVQGYLPKTNILYANHYELEILRLANMFAPENERIATMTQNTLQRLKNTCFGNSCMQGECFATGISVLRFLAVAQPEDEEWIDRLLSPLGEHFLSLGTGQATGLKKVPLTYLLMAFTDVNNQKTRELLRKRVEWLLDLLRKGRLTAKLSNGEMPEGDMNTLMKTYIIGNAIGILPEYKDIAKHEMV